MSSTVKKLPSLGAEANKLERLRTRIRKMEAALKEEKHKFDELSIALRHRMVEEGVESIRGTQATASVGTRDVARIEDYNRLSTYIYKQKALDLFQTRVSIKALRDRIEAGKKVPGVSIESLPILNLRTRSK